MKIGRIKFTTNKQTYYQEFPYSRWHYCIWWPSLWVYWYRSEEEAIEDMYKSR